MIINILIGFAVGIIIMIVGYKMGYKDGWREMFEFQREVCPKETAALVKQMEIVHEELRREYERGK